MKIELDDGYQFGLGLFETISLIEGIPVFPDKHIERINNSLKFFGIKQSFDISSVFEKINTLALKQLAPVHGLKLMASEKNKLISYRSNPYTAKRINEGFKLNFSNIIRNETSPLTRHKTMNYGDNILEKRRSHETEYDEFIFINTKGEICEGSTTNIFFVKDGKIITPPVESGLLPGIMRGFIMENADVYEEVIYPEDLAEIEECFVSNSLMGIIAANELSKHHFRKRTKTEYMQKLYKEAVEKEIKKYTKF